MNISGSGLNISTNSYASAQRGVDSAQNQLAVQAEKIANASAGNGDLTKASIGLATTETHAQAALKVLEVTDDMIGSLLDEYA